MDGQPGVNFNELLGGFSSLEEKNKDNTQKVMERSYYVAKILSSGEAAKLENDSSVKIIRFFRPSDSVVDERKEADIHDSDETASTNEASKEPYKFSWFAHPGARRVHKELEEIMLNDDKLSDRGIAKAMNVPISAVINAREALGVAIDRGRFKDKYCNHGKKFSDGERIITSFMDLNHSVVADLINRSVKSIIDKRSNMKKAGELIIFDDGTSYVKLSRINARRHYSDFEDEIINDLRLSNKQCAYLTGRTEKAISNKRFRTSQK